MKDALVVDDDPNSLNALAALVEMEGMTARKAASIEEARRLLGERKPDLVLCDLMLPDGRGTELLEGLEDDTSVDIILVTGQGSAETAIEALRLGACDYLPKPVDDGRLRTLLAGLIRSRDLKKEISSLREELRQLGRFGPLVGTSAPMQEVYSLIERVAPTDAPVLLIGESGTGKELAAEAVHQLSRRQGEPFLAVNCGAISPTLIESQLFGHERGAFTGASQRHEGYFEQAAAGTLLLDEVTEMPLDLQVKLLRVLETRTLTRVGGTRPIEVKARLIAATNRDPEKAVKEGHLREDLLYRLKVFPIHMPPLRERLDDLELLSLYFLTDNFRREGKRIRLSDEALERLLTYDWPGNVRELKNVIQRAVIMAEERITVDCLPPQIRGDQLPADRKPSLRVGMSIADLEKQLILKTVDHFQGDKRKSADVLGISLKTLYNRLNSYAKADED